MKRFFKTIIKTKLIDPTHIEVRDEQLNKHDLRIIFCNKKDYSACEHIGEPYMMLPLSKHSKGKVVNTQQSKFYPYKNYLILKFKWSPTGKIENAVLSDKKWRFEGDKAIQI